MFNFLSHKGNEQQNDINIPSHPSEWLSPRKQRTKMAGEAVGQHSGEEPLYMIGWGRELV
jgi:hypothetical protein